MQPAHWCPAPRVPCAHSPFIPRSRPWEVFTRPFVGKRSRASQGQPGEGRKELDLGPPKSCSRLYPAAQPVCQHCPLASTCPGLPSEPPGHSGLAHTAPDGLSGHERNAQIPHSLTGGNAYTDTRPTPAVGTNLEVGALAAHTHGGGLVLGTAPGLAHTDQLWQMPAAVFRVGWE